MDDAALVLAALEGDRDAFAAIYDRYAGSIHDFSYSVLRDRHEAADVTQDTFVLASEKLGQLREPSKLRSWLFAIARHRALRQSSRRARTVLTGEDADVVATEPGPDEPARQEELQRLVWDAAEGLSQRDRAILDLNLRHGLEGQELGEALGVEAGHAYVLVNRLKEQVERSLGALLVARHGRSNCEGLRTLLEDWDGKLSPLIRKRVGRHVDSCEVCSDGRKRLASPLALLSAMPVIAVPAEVREHVLGKLQLVSSSKPAPGWDKQGFPPGIEGTRSRRGGLVAVVAGVAALILLALLFSPRYDDRPSDLALEVGATSVVPQSVGPASSVVVPGAPVLAPEASTVAPPSGRPSTRFRTPAPGQPSLDTAPAATPPAGSPPADTPTSGRDGGIDVPTGGGDGIVAPNQPPPEAPRDDSPPVLSLSGSSMRCLATLTASVRDESAISSVTATWRYPDGSVVSARPMASQGGGSYSITTDPSRSSGPLTWSARATDAYGNSAEAEGAPITVAGCG